MRRMAWCAALVAAGCVGGSVEGAGDVAMDVADAVYWVQEGTGEPNVDGAVVVLLGDRPDVCAAIESGRFDGPWSFLALEAYPATSAVPVDVGDYPVGTSGRHAEVLRLRVDGGCRALATVAQAGEGTLTLTQGHGGAARDDVVGRFEGAMAGESATVEFRAARCDAGAARLTPHARSLRFKSCQ